MDKETMLELPKNIRLAKNAVNEALKPYGFRLVNADNFTIDTSMGILYIDCKLIKKL